MVTGCIMTEVATSSFIIDFQRDELFSHSESYTCTANVIAHTAQSNHYPVINYVSGSRIIALFTTPIEAGTSIGFICVGN